MLLCRWRLLAQQPWAAPCQRRSSFRVVQVAGLASVAAGNRHACQQASLHVCRLVVSGRQPQDRGDTFLTKCETPCRSAAGRLAMCEPSLQCVTRAHPLRLNLPSRGAAVGPVAQIAAAAATAGTKLDVSPACGQL